MKGVRVLLIATYELGKQPFGLASPAAFLRAAGHHVDVVDTSVQKVSLATVRQADMIGFHLPMHTATRMAARVSFALPAAVNSRARLFPGSEYSASAAFNATLLAARTS